MDNIFSDIESNTHIDNNVSLFASLSKRKKKEFLTQLKEIKNEAAGLFLYRVYMNENDKEIQKLIKKLLFRLKSMGIPVPELPLSGEPVLRSIEEKREHRGFLTNYDGTGARLVCALFEIKKKIFLFINAITHFSEGLLELAVTEHKSNEIEEILNSYREKTDNNTVFVEISPRYAGFLIEESSVISGRYTEDLKSFSTFVSHIHHTIKNPVDIYTLKLPETIKPLPFETLWTHDLIAPFMLSWEGMDEDRKTYNTGSGALVLPPYLVEEKKEAFLHTLMEKEEVKQKKRLIQRMFEDYAYMFYSLKDFSAYTAAIEVAKKEENIIGALQFFLKKSLNLPEEKEEQGILINPYDQIRR